MSGVIMRRVCRFISACAVFFCGAVWITGIVGGAENIAADAPETPIPEGFTPLFDGKTLDGWDADPKFWSVQDGEIVGESTPEKQVEHNSFVILRKIPSPKNFELLFDYRMSPGCNSGISFHADETPGKPWNILGHHADVFDHERHHGTFYWNGVQAWRGESVTLDASNKRVNAERFADEAELMTKVDRNGWNRARLRVDGEKRTLWFNGVKMAEVTEPPRKTGGALGFQIHRGEPMKIELKNIYYRELPERDVEQ